ncbi:MAG: hypothetical protein BWK79_00290 [Beggiatoa sp. IS2]|nr:MAG: hypothetical protein BWK79_00290 [Beggiatoa sp. IS2]
MYPETEKMIAESVAEAKKRSTIAKLISFTETSIRQIIGYGNLKQKGADIGLRVIGAAAGLVPFVGGLFKKLSNRAGELGKVKIAQCAALAPWRNALLDEDSQLRLYTENSLMGAQQQKEILDGLVDAIIKLEDAEADFANSYEKTIGKIEAVDTALWGYQQLQNTDAKKLLKAQKDKSGNLVQLTVESSKAVHKAAERYAYYIHRMKRLQFYADSVQCYTETAQEIASAHEQHIEAITSQLGSELDYVYHYDEMVNKVVDDVGDKKFSYNW